MKQVDGSAGHEFVVSPHVAADINIVIVVFRNPQEDVSLLMTTLLDAAAETGYSARASIVVNDDRRLALADDRTDVISGHGNVGFARGVALGVDNVDSRYTLLVNPDCLLDRESALVFLRSLAPGCGILVPLLEKRPGDIDVAIYENWVFTPTRRASRVACSLFLLSKRSSTLPRLVKAPGTFIGMETTIAQRLEGPFDRDFFLYGEDRDMTLRARRLGIPLRLVRDARVLHPGGASTEGMRDVVDRAKADGMLRVADRKYGRIGVQLMMRNLLWEARIKDALRGTRMLAARRWTNDRWARARPNNPEPLTQEQLDGPPRSLSVSSGE